MSSSTLYAELLLNIRQVTVFATLRSDQNEETKVELSPDRKSLSLTHDRETVSISLPSEVASSAILTLPAAKAKQLSFRLQVTEDTKGSSSYGAGLETGAPWPARSLTAETRVACRDCHNIITHRKINTWKNLPSENWAELMDFWHCHKPDSGGATQHLQSVTKGYAAINRLSVRPGLGLVDDLNLIVSEQDCSGIQNIDRNSLSLFCASCRKLLGTEATEFGGLRLYKWGICMQQPTSTGWEAFSLQNFISAQLLRLVDSQAARKFVIYGGTPQEASTALLLWVFTPELRYSFSNAPGGPKRAMKVLYQDLQNPRGILETQSVSFEELQLPSNIMQELRRDLQASNTILPDSARTLQQWCVGLLDRYEGEPSIHLGSENLQPAC